MTATFTLTDNTTIEGVTLYSKVTADYLIEEMGPVYTVFTGDGGHRYVEVEQVARIESTRPARKAAWYDLPMAAGMWASDGADLNA